jgi:predicted Zn-dependent protease
VNEQNKMFRRPASVLIAALVFSATVGFCPSANLAQARKSNSDTDINKIGHSEVGEGINLYSLDKEAAIGKQLAQELDLTSKFINDPTVIGYTNNLSQTIAQNSDSRFPITVRVIDSDVIDGFTLPGGYIYVNKGLILHTETEAELGSILAYFIASTALREGTRIATKGGMMQLAMMPLTLLGPYGWGGPGIYGASGLTIPVTYFKLRRDFASSADYFGLQYLYKSGYDPESMPRFFERVWPLSPAGTGTVPKVFSPYPPLEDRLKAMRTEIQKILPGRDNATVSTSDFETVKEHLRSWNPPNPKNPGGVKPTLRKPASVTLQSSQW